MQGDAQTHTRIKTQQGASIGRTYDKKVNKQSVMKINDTNHKRALTHFFLFRSDDCEALF